MIEAQGGNPAVVDDPGAAAAGGGGGAVRGAAPRLRRARRAARGGTRHHRARRRPHDDGGQARSLGRLHDHRAAGRLGGAGRAAGDDLRARPRAGSRAAGRRCARRSSIADEADPPLPLVSHRVTGRESSCWWELRRGAQRPMRRGGVRRVVRRRACDVRRRKWKRVSVWNGVRALPFRRPRGGLSHGVSYRFGGAAYGESSCVTREARGAEFEWVSVDGVRRAAVPHFIRPPEPIPFSTSRAPASRRPPPAARRRLAARRVAASVVERHPAYAVRKRAARRLRERDSTSRRSDAPRIARFAALARSPPAAASPRCSPCSCSSRSRPHLRDGRDVPLHRVAQRGRRAAACSGCTCCSSPGCARERQLSARSRGTRSRVRAGRPEHLDEVEPAVARCGHTGADLGVVLRQDVRAVRRGTTSRWRAPRRRDADPRRCSRRRRARRTAPP